MRLLCVVVHMRGREGRWVIPNKHHQLHIPRKPFQILVIVLDEKTSTSAPDRKSGARGQNRSYGIEMTVIVVYRNCGCNCGFIAQ